MSSGCLIINKFASSTASPLHVVEKTSASRWSFPFLILDTTIGDKIVETLYLNRVTSENKRIRTLPCPLHSKLGCLLFSIGS